ncbi:hypothetical protein ACS0TY_032867 [Phlomoides rotata]
MFLTWFDCNKKYREAGNLTYALFPQYFVWKPKTREWVKRQRGFSIRRICYVPSGSGEAHYLRILPNVVRGPKYFDDLGHFNGVLY